MPDQYTMDELKELESYKDVETAQRILDIETDVEQQVKKRTSDKEIALKVASGLFNIVRATAVSVDKEQVSDALFKTRDEVNKYAVSIEKMDYIQAKKALKRLDSDHYVNALRKEMSDTPEYMQKKAVTRLEAVLGKAHLRANMSLSKRVASSQKARLGAAGSMIRALAVNRPESNPAEIVAEAAGTMGIPLDSEDGKYLLNKAYDGAITASVNLGNVKRFDKLVQEAAVTQLPIGSEKLFTRPGVIKKATKDMMNLVGKIGESSANENATTDYLELHSRLSNSGNPVLQRIAQTFENEYRNDKRKAVGRRGVSIATQQRLRGILSKSGLTANEQEKLVAGFRDYAHNNDETLYGLLFATDTAKMSPKDRQKFGIYYNSVTKVKEDAQALLAALARGDQEAVEELYNMIEGETGINREQATYEMAKLLANKTGKNSIERKYSDIMLSSSVHLTDETLDMDISATLQALPNLADNAIIKKGGYNPTTEEAEGLRNYLGDGNDEVIRTLKIKTAIQLKKENISADDKEYKKKFMEAMNENIASVYDNIKGEWKLYRFGREEDVEDNKHLPVKLMDSLSEEQQDNVQFGINSLTTSHLHAEREGFSAISRKILDNEDFTSKLVTQDDGSRRLFFVTEDGAMHAARRKGGGFVDINMRDWINGKSKLFSDQEALASANKSLYNMNVVNSFRQRAGKRGVSRVGAGDVMHDATLKKMGVLVSKHKNILRHVNDNIQTAGVPADLAPVFMQALLQESAFFSDKAKGVKAIKTRSGEIVKVGGWAQMSEPLRKRYEEKGFDLGTPSGAAAAMSDHMLWLMADTYNKSSDEQKSKLTTSNLFSIALKRYNGGSSFAGNDTRQRALDNRGSHGNNETRDHVVAIMSAYTPLTDSELRGEGANGRPLPPTKNDSIKRLSDNVNKSSAMATALARQGFDVTKAVKALEGRVQDNDALIYVLKRRLNE